MGEKLIHRLGPHYILWMMVATRLVGSVGGAAVIYYINFTMRLPPLVYQHFHVAAPLVVAVAVIMTVVLGVWETPDLRRVLRRFRAGQPVEPLEAHRAGEQAVMFAGRHHLHEALLIPAVTILPLLIYLRLAAGATAYMLIHMTIAAVLGIILTLMCTFFVVERWMAPVVRHLLCRGVVIDFDRLPASRLRVRLNMCFSLMIFTTALMISSLANEGAADIIRDPRNQAQAVAQLQSHSVYIALAAIGLGLAFSNMLAASVATRVATLVAAMKRVQQGNLQLQLTPTGTDEIDLLTRQFNSMVRQLAHNDAVIRDLNANLERKVRQRTRQLSKSRAAVARSLAKLQRYDRMKTEFFSNVSHELRTPLTMIVAPVDRLISQYADRLPRDVTSMLETVRINGYRLLELITRLLDFSKLEAGRMRLRLAAVDLNGLVEELVTAARPLADQRGVALEARLDSALPPLLGDREKLDIVVTNLLSNAIKFTPRGGEVHIRTQLDGQSAAVVVSDTGIGIDPADHERIFDRFVQVDGSWSREFAGTGLGLALARELVQMHDGAIRVDSQLGHGATFRAELPVRAVVESPPASDPTGDGPPAAADQIAANRFRGFADLIVCESVSASAAADAGETSNANGAADNGAAYANEPPATGDAHLPATSAGDATSHSPDGASHVALADNAGRDLPTVLIADDTPEMRDLLVDILRGEYRVLVAADGLEALAAVERQQPELILSDVMMPRIDGYQLCRRLKQNAATAQIPFVMLTAKAGEAARVGGLECGADDYLAKPFSQRELLARVRGLVKLRRLHQDLERRNRELDAAYRELAALQAHLIQAEKMSSLGQLVAGLAHEINNSINAVYNGIKPLSRYTQRLQSLTVGPSGPDDDAAAGEIQSLFENVFTMTRVIEHGATRTARIVADLKTFSHPGNERHSEFDLHQALDICINLMDSHIRHRIKVVRDYGDVRRAYGPCGQLNQVFMNLLNNAQQAIEGTGEITVATRQNDTHVTVSIRDTGTGIPDDIKHRIFDPFFTTKKPGQGTGLGLSLSYGLITKLGGTIECHSELGRGTQFDVHIPNRNAILPASHVAEESWSPGELVATP
jgi:signal transduction histidine kinase